MVYTEDHKHTLFYKMSYIGFPSGPMIDPDARNVIESIEATTPLSDAQKTAINDRVKGWKAASLWDGLIADYGFVGGTATAHSINFKNPLQYQLVWGGSVTHNMNGVTGDGLTGHAMTGIAPRAVGSVDSFTQAIYCRTNNSSFGADLSTFDGSTYSRLFLRGDDGVTSIFDCPYGPGHRPTIPNISGHIGWSRTGYALQTSYRNASPTGSYTDDASAAQLPNSQLIFLSEGGLFFSNRNIASVVVAQGWSAADWLAAYQMEQQYQSELGRAV